ncbi:hypothetical protein FI667_g3034, partial [Globisporangium splendens]
MKSPHIQTPRSDMSRNVAASAFYSRFHAVPRALASASGNGAKHRDVDVDQHDVFVRNRADGGRMRFLAWFLCGFKFVEAVRNNGGILQRRIFMLCMYASLTIMARGVDPGSYGHFTPRPLSHFFINSCTATLYTIYIMSLCFYVSVSHFGDIRKERSLEIFERVSIGAVWLFYVGTAMSTFSDHGFGGVSSRIQLLVSAGFLAIISTGFLMYGFQLIRNLEYMEAMNTHRDRHLDEAHSGSDSCRTVDYSVEDPRAILDEVKRRPLKPADRIRKILFTTEIMALLCIGAQVFFAMERNEAKYDIELECANGRDCEKVKTSVSLLHIFQFFWILVAMWCYRKIQKQKPAADERV